MASPYSDIRNIINFAICWNSLVLISTLQGKNLISYTQSADNLSLYSVAEGSPYPPISCSDDPLRDMESKKLRKGDQVKKDNKQSVSETTRETSFNFSEFRGYYNTLFGNNPKNLSDD